MSKPDPGAAAQQVLSVILTVLGAEITEMSAGSSIRMMDSRMAVSSDLSAYGRRPVTIYAEVSRQKTLIIDCLPLRGHIPTPTRLL